MLKFLLLWLIVYVIFVLTVNAAEDGEQFRVVGGYRPKKHTLAKYIVSLRLRSSKDKYGWHLCGGSILSPKIILTAAHCVIMEKPMDDLKPEDIFVSAGSPMRLIKESSTQFIDVSKIITHEGYTSNMFTKKHDIALLHLEKDIVEDGITAQRTPIASVKTAAGKICTAVGWGNFIPEGSAAAEVTYVDLEILSLKKCRKIIVSLEVLYILRLRPFQVRKTVVCTIGIKEHISNTCQGDSGGPLFCDGTVVGVTSFGQVGCALNSFYTSVYHYRDWIKEHSIQ